MRAIGEYLKKRGRFWIRQLEQSGLVSMSSAENQLVNLGFQAITGNNDYALAA